MFDWFMNMFKTPDPEAGVPAGDYTGIGRVQGPNEGTGEGWPMMPMKPSMSPIAMMDQQLGANRVQSGLTSGFDMNWLSNQVNQASAQGKGI
jgi:hypothetical protein